MNETTLTETLDRRGDLEAAQGPGTYALECDAPDNREAVARRWASISDTPLPDGYAARIAEAQTVAYVGASNNSVYHRLSDHVASDKRQATFLLAFPPVDVIDVWPSNGDAMTDEYNRARAVSDGTTVAWSDGRLF
jgi:hypothetical protein